MTPSQINPRKQSTEGKQNGQRHADGYPSARQFNRAEQEQDRHQPQPVERKPDEIDGPPRGPLAREQRERQARQRRDHARRGQPERQRRRVARHRDGRDADDQGQRTQNPDPPPGRWAVVLPAPVCNPTQDPIDRGVDHHHGAGGDQPGHPVAAPGHGVEGLRQGNAGRAVAVQEDRVPVGDGEPVVEEAEDEQRDGDGRSQRGSPPLNGDHMSARFHTPDYRRRSASLSNRDPDHCSGRQRNTQHCNTCCGAPDRRAA